MKKKKYNGHHRLDTPQNRLKRAAAYRHVKNIHTFSEQITDKAAEVSVAEEAPAVEAEEEEQIQEESVSEPPVKKLSWRERRKKKKNEWVEAMVTQPNATLWKVLVHPIRTLNQASESEYLSLGRCKELIWHMIAWLSAASCVAYFYMQSIADQEYSIARINFTQTAWVAVRIALFSLILGYIGYWAIAVYGLIVRRSVSHAKLMEMDALSALPCALLFIISLVLMKKAPGSALFIFILFAAAAIALKLYGLYKATRFNWIQLAVFALIYVCAYTMLYEQFYTWAFGDLIAIYKLL